MLIALTGYARAGKDTVGQILVEQHGFTRVSFADKLKAMALRLDPVIEVSPDEETTPYHARLSEIVDLYGGLDQAKELPEVRGYLQHLGVTARDCIHHDVWVSAALEPMPAGDVVITDCRFRNEAAAVADRGGKIVRVIRPGVQAVNAHVSEHDLADWPIDAEIHNNTTLEDLAQSVRILVPVMAHRTTHSQVLDNPVVQ